MARRGRSPTLVGTKLDGPQLRAMTGIFVRKKLRPLRLHVILEALIETREASAAVDEVLLSARPGGMGGWINIERELLVRLAPGRAGSVGRPVVQDDGHHVIVGMNVFFHRAHSRKGREAGAYRAAAPS